MHANFDQKVVLIAGGCSGIGLATVRVLLAAKAKVYCLDIRTPLDEHLATGSNENFHFQQADISSAQNRAAAVADCQKRFGGRIDCLLNVAGALDNFAGLDSVSDESWNRMLLINLTAPAMLIREVLPVMISQGGGSIVNVCSIAAICGTGAGVAYTAAKTGLAGLTKSTAWRYRGDNIRVNAVCPGGLRLPPAEPVHLADGKFYSGVATNIYDTLREDIDHAGLSRLKPLADVVMGERRGSPEDQANVIAFLASDLSREMTGTIIPVDNGLSCK